MDWNLALNVGGPLAALIVGGLFGRRKTKADSHSVVVADAVTMAKHANDSAERANKRADDALRRLDEMEDRERRRDELARQHLRWDWRMLRSLQDAGLEVSDPPPLFLYDELKGA